MLSYNNPAAHWSCVCALVAAVRPGAVVVLDRPNYFHSCACAHVQFFLLFPNGHQDDQRINDDDDDNDNQARRLFKCNAGRCRDMRRIPNCVCGVKTSRIEIEVQEKKNRLNGSLRNVQPAAVR